MSIDATYEITLSTPMGPQKSKLTLKQDGDTLTGSSEASNGDSVAVEDGRVDGDTLTWSSNVTKPMPIKLEFTATIDGDNISGEAKLGAFGTAKFSGGKV